MGPKSPNGTFQNVKKVFVDWSKNVAFQSYPKIFDDELHFLVKFLWLLVFLVFSGITSYLCVQSILVYLQWGIVSTIEIIRESPTEFPAVTICDSNPFTTKEAQTLLEQLAFQKFNINISNINKTQFDVYKENLTEYARMVVNDPSYGDEKRKLLGFYNLPSIDPQGSFNLTFFPFNTRFEWYWHAFYGNCYQINMKTTNILRQSSEGENNGLILKY